MPPTLYFVYKNPAQTQNEVGSGYESSGSQVPHTFALCQANIEIPQN